MEFTCPSCHSRNIVADEQVRNPALGVKCVTCGYVYHLPQGGPVTDYYGAMNASSRPPYDYSGAGFSYQPQSSPITQEDWHYSVNGQSFGPYSLDLLRGMFVSGELGPDVYVWHEIYDQVGWQLAKDVEFFSDIFSSPRVGQKPIPTGHSMISEAFDNQVLSEVTARRASQPRLDLENINALRRKLNSNPLGDALRASISSSNPSVTSDSPTVPETAALKSPRPTSSKSPSIHNLRATRLAAEKISSQAAHSSTTPAADPPSKDELRPPASTTTPYLPESSADFPDLPEPNAPSYNEPQELGPAGALSTEIPSQSPSSRAAGTGGAPRSHPGANRRPRPSRTQIEDSPKEVESFMPTDLPVQDERPFEPADFPAKKSSKGLPILIVLIVIALAAGAAYFFLFAQKTPGETPSAEAEKPAPSDSDTPAAAADSSNTLEGENNAEGESGLPVPVPESESDPDSEGEEAPAEGDTPSETTDLNGVFQNARFADGSDIKTPRVAPPNAPKVLTQEQALEGIRKVSRGVEVCRERFVRQGGAFDTDKITLSLTVLGSGDVDKVEIKPPSLEKGEFARCINSQRSRWKFFATGGPPQRVVRGFVIQ